MRTLAALIALVSLVLGGLAAAEEAVVVKVFKTPTCGCCAKWVSHLEANGFRVETTDMRDLTRVKADRGVPPRLASCHTAVVAGYVVEGHVPAADVTRLLAERPPVLGLAVPGMPIGSPGMEGPNPETYRVLSFDGQGHTDVFSTQRP